VCNRVKRAQSELGEKKGNLKGYKTPAGGLCRVRQTKPRKIMFLWSRRARPWTSAST
jgi:hypothetical protein